MRKLLLAVLVLLAAPHASAQEYGHYDLKRLIASADPTDRKQPEATPPGDKYHALDVAYLDQVMDDLSVHAKNYPPNFGCSLFASLRLCAFALRNRRHAKGQNGVSRITVTHLAERVVVWCVEARTRNQPNAKEEEHDRKRTEQDYCGRSDRSAS